MRNLEPGSVTKYFSSEIDFDNVEYSRILFVSTPLIFFGFKSRFHFSPRPRVLGQMTLKHRYSTMIIAPFGRLNTTLVNIVKVN